MFLVPLFLGGRHPWGQAILILCAFVAAAGGVIRTLLLPRPSLRFCGADWLILCGTALILSQLLPLPLGLLQYLSPRVEQLLPLWFTGSGQELLGSWSLVSLAPSETIHSFWIFLCYVFLFYATINSLQGKEDLIRLSGWIGTAGIIAAVLAFAQYAGGTDRFLGIYEHPFRKASEYLTGSFSTKNHFAHFLVLTLGPLLFFLMRSTSPLSAGRFHFPRASATKGTLLAVVVAAGVGLLLLAILGSLSRGGVMAGVVAIATFVVALGYSRVLRFRFVVAILLICLLAGVLAFSAGGGKIRQRLASLTSGNLEALDHNAARRLIWSTTLKALPDFAPLGSGAGSFREVYPIYLSRHDFPRYFTHAESGYLQLALETGFPGVVLLLAGIATIASWFWRAARFTTDPELQVLAGAVAASLSASVFHSFFDFVWYVPGCMTLTVILAGCLCRLAQLSLPHQSPAGEKPLPKGALIVLLVGLTLWASGGFVWMSQFALASASWEHYLISVRRDGGFHSATPTAAAFHGGEITTEATNSHPPRAHRPDAHTPRARAIPTRIIDDLCTWDQLRGSPPLDGTDESSRGAEPCEHAGVLTQGWEPKGSSTESIAFPETTDFSSAGGTTSRQKDCYSSMEEEKDDGRQEQVRKNISLLTNTVRWFPWFARAHLELAWRYLELFDLEQGNSDVPLPLAHIRDAANRAPFPSAEARTQWLSQILGDRHQYLITAKRHAVQAISLCPLLGEAYLLLAELEFLEHSRPPLEELLVQQALRVRPRDGNILFLVGQRAIVAGDTESGLRWWQQAARYGLVYQTRIVRLLLGRICPYSPAMEMNALLELFDPDLPVLQLIHSHYSSRVKDEELVNLRERIADQAQKEAELAPPAQAAALHLLAAEMYAKLGRNAERLRAARNAFRYSPSDYRIRYSLAEAELAIGNFREAEKHFQWCAFRNPGNQTVRAKLRRVREQHLIGNLGSAE